MADGSRRPVKGAPDNNWLEGDVRGGGVHFENIAPAHQQEVGGGGWGTYTNSGGGLYATLTRKDACWRQGAV